MGETMTAALHAEIVQLIAAARHRATCASDLVAVVDEWAFRNSYAEIKAALAEAQAYLDTLEPEE